MSGLGPRVAIFSTGGMIASKRSDDGAASPNLTADDLVTAVPQLADIANITAVSFRQVASSELTVSDVIGLAKPISGAVADGATGAVITQGTNTIEETSFVLDLLWDREEPIVVTGAMRHPGLPGADRPANLLASAIVAASH
jgi:L-asparaginase